MTEVELREKIADEIRSIDLSEGKEISSDWYAASLRTQMICAIVAQKGLPEAKND
jgi:hypothetical protein